MKNTLGPCGCVGGRITITAGGDFPVSPKRGDIHFDDNGTVWKYDGRKWEDMGTITVPVRVPYFGGAEPNDIPSPVAGDGFWIVTEPGVYTNFGGVSLLAGSHMGVISRIGGVYSIQPVNFDLSDYATKDLLLIDQTSNVLTEIDLTYQNNTSTPFIEVPSSATSAWLQNNNIFRNGQHYNKLTAPSGSAVTGVKLDIPIPLDLRRSGVRYRMYVTYKLTGTVNLYMYFRNGDNTAWINNNGGVPVSLINTTEEKVAVIDRDYDAGAGIAVLYISQLSAGGVLDIGNVSFYAVGDVNRAYLNAETMLTFGFNPSYTLLNPYLIGALNGSSTQQWLDNDMFSSGSKKLVLTALGGNIVNHSLRIKLPDDFIGDTTRIIQVTFTYILKGTAFYALYQRNQNDTAWSDNTFSKIQIPPTLKEATISMTTAIKANTGYINLALDVNSDGVLQVGNVKMEIVGGAKQASVTGVTTIVVDVAGSGSFTSIRSAIKSITAASKQNRYLVFVKNGTYNEFDITGANYLGDDPSVVTVEGESREGVIIRTDGTSSTVTPPDYSYPGSGNKGVPFNSIPRAERHALYIQETITFKNLTIHANDVKYAVHQDNTAKKYKSLFENVRIIHEETTSNSFANCVGIGARHGQFQNYRNCIFEARLGNLIFSEVPVGVFWHNWNNQNGAAGLIIEDCEYINYSYLHAAELGSNQNDIITLNRCRSNLQYAQVIYSLTPGFYNPTPATPYDYPYNIQLQITGTSVGYFDLRDERRDAGYNALSINDYHIPVYNAGVSAITKGTPMITRWDMPDENNVYCEPAIGNYFDFIAWRDIPATSSGFGIPSGKSAMVVVDSQDYFKGDMVTLLSGTFTKTTDPMLAAGYVLNGTKMNGTVKICFRE